jgi:hypothetical protein
LFDEEVQKALKQCYDTADVLGVGVGVGGFDLLP